jgi:hypothetical protein
VRLRFDLKVVRGTQTYQWDERHSFAMRRKEDAWAFRHLALTHFELLHSKCEYIAIPLATLNIPTPDRCLQSVPRTGILNHRKDRSLQNVAQPVTPLEQSQATTNRTAHVNYVTTFEETSFRHQLAFLSQFDNILSPHGAQFTGLLFLPPPCSQVVELFPASYLVPTFYGSLAAVSGVEDSYLYLGASNPQQRKTKVEGAMQSLESREAARRAHLCLHPTPSCVRCNKSF